MLDSAPTIWLSLDQPSGQFWIDTGLVVLVEQFGEGEHSVDDVLNWLLKQLVQPTGKKGEYYDQATKQLREYDKVNWVYPTNIFIKVAGKSGKKVKINGQDYPTQPPQFELDLDLSKRSDPCDLCGNRAPLTDAKMWMYPFVVDPQKFGTFYSGTKRGLRLCARCALAGLAAYLGWLWRAQGGDVLHFFVFHSELKELVRLHREVLGPLRISGEKVGTAPVEFSGPYIHETTLGLLLGLFRHVRESDRLSEEARELLATLLGAADAPPAPITLYAITGTSGQAFTMQAVREFSKLQRLYRLYEQWLEVIQRETQDPNPHRRLVKVLQQFGQQQGKSAESIWRDKICWAILEFGDPLPFVEQFLYEARAKEDHPRPLVRGTIEVLNHYVREVLGMNEQFQRILAGFGRALGTAAHEHNEMGLLYALRNAKNPEDFYRMLNDAQFRLGIPIPEALLKIERGERIAGTPWVRVKTLLSIYAMNAFLERVLAQKGAPQQESETVEVSGVS
ncbi:MAG: hypothetical protein N0A24_08860 [Armatimonadetes bacterium]|nr:hypothetical protein [Armatimonadota bacterium]MDW8154299.1 hypothetical protein [Armatimonadota bacterium]